MLQVKATTSFTVSTQPPVLSNGGPQKVREAERLQAASPGWSARAEGATACPELITTATRTERKSNKNAMQIQQPAFCLF